MDEILDRLSYCIEFGKMNKAEGYPPEMKDQDGADELTRQALDRGISPESILYKALISGMERVGKKFAENKVYVPQMLMSARAMTEAMKHIKPYFSSGEVKHKGVFIIGTVQGDLHDIGKNLVAMMLEGSGWKVIDLGNDVRAEQFVDTARQHPGCIVGLSALLTTTMANMEKIVSELKTHITEIKVAIGGAPVNRDFCKKIGADFYSPDPHGLVNILNKEIEN